MWTSCWMCPMAISCCMGMDEKELRWRLGQTIKVFFFHLLFSVTQSSKFWIFYPIWQFLFFIRWVLSFLHFCNADVWVLFFFLCFYFYSVLLFSFTPYLRSVHFILFSPCFWLYKSLLRFFKWLFLNSQYIFNHIFF